MARVGFEPRPCGSRSRRFNHSTTLPKRNSINDTNNHATLITGLLKFKKRHSQRTTLCRTHMGCYTMLYSARGQIGTVPVRAALERPAWALHSIVGWVGNCGTRNYFLVAQPIILCKRSNCGKV